MFLSLLVTLLTQAPAAEIQVVLDKPINIVVDGKPYIPADMTLQINARNLGGGTHLVEARNMLGQKVTAVSVTVGENEQVRLRYVNQSIVELGRSVMAPMAPPPPPPVVVVHTPPPPPPAAHVSVGVVAPATTLSASVNVSEEHGMVESNTAGASMSISMSVSGDPYAGQHMETAGTPYVAAAPPEPVPVYGPVMMSEPDLRRLLQAVEDATFGSDQVSVLRTAAGGNHFSCRQVVRLLEPLDHDSDKVSAVRALHSAIVDPQKSYELEQAFTFSSDKEAVRQMF